MDKLTMESFDGTSLEIFAMADRAGRQIPPLWPLTESVAVNPFIGQSAEPLAMTAARMARVAGIRVTAPRATINAKIASGAITTDDLQAALDAAPGDTGLTLGALRAAAAQDTDDPTPLPTLADLAAKVTGVDWPALVAERMGLWAAGHFDAGQALWPAPDIGAYAAWKAHAQRDVTPELHGLTGFCAHVTDMPPTARVALAVCARELGLSADAAEHYFHRLLVDLGGWAQLARRPGWQAEQAGGSDPTLTDLLTARLVWEAALFARHRTALEADWDAARSAYAAPLQPDPEQVIDAILQDAADRAAQRTLADGFDAHAGALPDADARPAIQAAFCIDVRSEVFRRALESAGTSSGAGIDTIGFAGFFGLASAHHGAASDVTEPRAPVLLTPGLHSRADQTDAADMDQRIRARAARAWGRFRQAAVSSFAFVEAAGPIYGAKLWRDAAGHGHAHALPDRDSPAPVLDPLPPVADRVQAAATVLGAMGLNGPMARLVLLAGHGAGVTNNPHASALQCGACGGYAGDVNARLLAGLLNDPEVRAGLAETGRSIPADTLFVAGLHDTTTDAVILYDKDHPSPEHADDLKALKAALKTAGKIARAERAARLPRADGAADIAARARDWAELRPEWGLAGCRAFVAAPRARTARLDLGGGVFLHSYDWHKDDGFGVLELILTAPVVVASWISLQYYGSTVAPSLFGAGNKLLHNVTGGIGVVEGNGGVLRAGLPMQSVHDGDAPVHDPLRLTVVVEAPRAAISDILGRHPGVAALFDNGWLALYAMDDTGRMAWRYDRGDWVGAGGANPKAIAAE
jgi:uncharacterized protein YbcC (UPF0753/DUF2309 family)